jgi:hypothetical protein
MTEIFVTKAGNDSTGDGSEALPYLTIMKALGVAQPNTQINVGVGTWSERIVITASSIPGMSGASAAAPIRLRGTRASAALDAAYQTILTPQSGQTTLSLIYGGSWSKGLEFEDLDLLGTAAQSSEDEWVVKLNGSNATAGGVYTFAHEDFALRRNRFRGTGRGGFKLVGGLNGVFEGNLFSGLNVTESLIDFIRTEGVTVGYNTADTTARGGRFLTFKGGTRDCIGEHNDIRMITLQTGASVVYAGNGSVFANVEHSSTDFDVAEALRCIIRRNYFATTRNNSSHTMDGVRTAGGVDIDVLENWFEQGVNDHVQLQKMMSWPTSHEISAATYNALTTGQKADVTLSQSRYFAAHRCLGVRIADNRAKAGSFAINNIPMTYHPSGQGTNPTTTSTVSPATRGYLATGNTAVSSGVPTFIYGYLNLP